MPGYPSKTIQLYGKFAAAFVRGRQLQGEAIGLDDRLMKMTINSLSDDQLLHIFQTGHAAALKLYKFKRKTPLARVTKVLGMLRSIAPTSLLDVGSGRGTFLWPLLDQFPYLDVTAIDFDDLRSRDLMAVQLGGIDRLTAHQMDLTSMQFNNNQFDAVTTLEVLEHIPNFEAALSEATRVARRFVIVSVPSKPDDNPEHIHLLTKDRLTEAFHRAGCQRLNFDSVLNHLIVVASVGKD